MEGEEKGGAVDTGIPEEETTEAGDNPLCRLLVLAHADEKVLDSLLLQFDPLLQKYARMLGYQEAYEELYHALLILLLELDIRKLDNPSDGAAVNYIRHSVYHRYIALSRRRRQYVKNYAPFDACAEREVASRPEAERENDELKFIERDFLRCFLKEDEYEVILLHYVDGYTIREIARMKHITRQAINHKKLKALEKLRKAYQEYYNI